MSKDSRKCEQNSQCKVRSMYDMCNVARAAEMESEGQGRPASVRLYRTLAFVPEDMGSHWKDLNRGETWSDFNRIVLESV